MAEDRVATSDSGETGRAQASRFRLHYVYYALAAFDVLALTLSVTILFLITSSYQKSVGVNGYWADRIHDLALLTEAASRVNSPGNEAFRGDEGDTDAIERVKTERRKIETALDDFERRRRKLRADLDAGTDRSTGDEIAVSLAGVTEPMKRMVAESDAIFDHLLDGDVGEAGKRMARMDEQYGQVLRRLRDTSELAAGVQQANLESQLEFASRLQRAEIAFAAVILFTVGMVTVYGRKLAQRMRDFQTELTQYHDHLEALVQERTQELEESLEKLRVSDRLASIGSLAAGLGHDMNNVLFPVRCWLDALGEADLDESSQAELASIRQSVEYLQQLSDGLRLLALDPEQDAAEPGATDLQTWWDDVRPLFLTALPKAATLEGEIAIGLPPVGLARHQLTQAVFNLVVNAGAAIADGGTVRVRVRADDDGQTVSIGVTDDGHGMTEEVRRQALDPFFTTKKRALSTGLGLGLVQGVTKAVGGRVAIDSAPGRGTTVTLSLPLVGPGAAVPVEAERWATVSIRDRRIATFAGSLLRSAGFDVTEAAGEAAPGGSLWVTDEALSAEAVEAFLDGEADRHVIVLTSSAPERNHPRVRLVDRKSGLGAMRQAIQDISQRLSERDE